MQESTFFMLIDTIVVLGSTIIFFLFSKTQADKVLHFLKTLAYILGSIIAGYFCAIYAMISGISRDDFMLSAIFISISNLLIFLVYVLRYKQKTCKLYPIIVNIIYMSTLVYLVHYFGHM